MAGCTITRSFARAFRRNRSASIWNGSKGTTNASRPLYVVDQNDGKLVARTRFFWSNGAVLGVSAHREECARDEPIRHRQVRHVHWRQGHVRQHVEAAKNAGKLHLRYEGIERVEKAGRPAVLQIRAHTLRSALRSAGEEGTHLRIDDLHRPGHALQVGSILVDENGEFVAEYFFRDIEINPKFRREAIHGEGAVRFACGFALR